MLSGVWFFANPGSFVHGILQARILGWFAISFSVGPSWPRDQPVSSALQVDTLPLSYQGSSISWGLLFSVNFYYIFLIYNVVWLLFFKIGYSNLDFIQPLVLSAERNLCFTTAHRFSEFHFDFKYLDLLDNFLENYIFFSLMTADIIQWGLVLLK